MSRVRDFVKYPEPKYWLGDTVWMIRLEQYTEKLPCDQCDRTGQAALLKGGHTYCSPCHGKGYIWGNVRQKWVFAGEDVVGQVRPAYTIARAGYFDSELAEIDYMLVGTGIGTGTVWRENLLLSSEDAAHQECETRNLALETQEAAAESQ